MGVSKANLQIDALRIIESEKEMGIEFHMNQPISLNSKQAPVDKFFLSNKELCKIFQQLRKD